MKPKPIKDKTEVGGMFGEKIDVTKVRGKLVVANRPVRKITAKPTESQNSAKKNFTEAASYAKKQVRNKESKEIYATGITDSKTNAYIVALKDYLTPPKVDRIDTEEYTGEIGSLVVIKASDDFQVTKVKIVITDPSGTKLEQAESTQDPDKAFKWEYQTTVANATLVGTKIKVTAYDRAGNKASLEKVVGIV
jgi:hypothetical protein